MPQFGLFKKRQQHISKALIRQHLGASDSEDDTETASKCSDGEYLYQETYPTGCSSEGDLPGCKAWLDQLCRQEQDQVDEALEDDRCRKVGAVQDQKKDEDGLHRGLKFPCSFPDSATLQRIREGRGPRDKVPEDLLAPFRDAPLQAKIEESYGEMRKVLLAWNRTVSGDVQGDENARESLRIAVERRTHLLKTPARGSDKSHFLEDSSSELLQALTALRPEIADFKNKEFLDVLVTMWANIRIARPDLDDELKTLTMKALINELESRSHTSNAVKLSGLARSLSVAKLMLDTAEIERLENKMKGFEKKLCEAVVKRAIDKIKAGRRELLEVTLEELQQLTELQAAQKWATHIALSRSQHRPDQIRACEEADNKLQRALQCQIPELDAHVQAVQSNANALAGLGDSLLTRAVEGGLSLEEQHATSSEPPKAEVKAYVTGGIADILKARDQAARMFGQMKAVEDYLEMMLDVAKSQYQACDEILRLAEQTDNNYDLEVQRDERMGFGLRRESILLICRNMQRSKQGQ